MKHRDAVKIPGTKKHCQQCLEEDVYSHHWFRLEPAIFYLISIAKDKQETLAINEGDHCLIINTHKVSHLKYSFVKPDQEFIAGSTVEANLILDMLESDLYGLCVGQDRFEVPF